MIAKTYPKPELPIYTNVDLINAGDLALRRRGRMTDAEVKCLSTRAIVDSDFYDLWITDLVCNQLDLTMIQKRVFRLANEELIEVDVVGPVEVRIEDRHATMNAVVMPDGANVLLGSQPMTAMGVKFDRDVGGLVDIGRFRRL